MTPSAWLLSNCRFASSGIAFSALPDDMQVLISDYIPDEHWPQLQQHVFAVKNIPTASFPDVAVGTNPGDSRNEEYARGLIGQPTPPVLLFGAAWIDGKHRVWAAKEAGSPSVPAIDLAELRIPGLQIADRLGRIG